VVFGFSVATVVPRHGVGHAVGYRTSQDATGQDSLAQSNVLGWSVTYYTKPDAAKKGMTESPVYWNSHLTRRSAKNLRSSRPRKYLPLS
jgi:hypothetical protein